jgi:hypothetical protein
MNRKILFLPLLLLAVIAMAESKPSVVPAMIVHGMDGSRQVLQLDATDVSDLIILQAGQSLSVDIPEAQVSGVRSIIFAMVAAADDIPTAIECTETPLVRSVEKVVREGKVIIRLQIQNGTILEYDIQGNQLTNK